MLITRLGLVFSSNSSDKDESKILSLGNQSINKKKFTLKNKKYTKN